MYSWQKHDKNLVFNRVTSMGDTKHMEWMDQNVNFAYNPKQTCDQHLQASPNGKILQLFS